MEIGESDYRAGGLERLRESQLLLSHELFAGSVYLAGRAVESLLRALVWRFDREIRSGKRSLDTGHNLRELLALVADLGVLRSAPDREQLVGDVQHASRLWLNNMRFIPNAKLKSHWWKLREIGSRRTLKQAARDFHADCTRIVKRCDSLCEN